MCELTRQYKFDKERQDILSSKISICKGKEVKRENVQ